MFIKHIIKNYNLTRPGITSAKTAFKTLGKADIFLKFMPARTEPAKLTGIIIPQTVFIFKQNEKRPLYAAVLRGKVYLLRGEKNEKHYELNVVSFIFYKYYYSRCLCKAC